MNTTTSDTVTAPWRRTLEAMRPIEAGKTYPLDWVAEQLGTDPMGNRGKRDVQRIREAIRSEGYVLSEDCKLRSLVIRNLEENPDVVVSMAERAKSSLRAAVTLANATPRRLMQRDDVQRLDRASEYAGRLYGMIVHTIPPFDPSRIVDDSISSEDLG